MVQSLTQADPLALVRAALGGRDDVWIVGGAVRDRLLGRGARRPDLDIVLAGDVAEAAQLVRRQAPHGTAAFALSDTFGAWRLVGPEQAWQVDVSPLLGGTLDADLRQRDLTVNAIAEPLSGGALVDPTGGLADLERRVLRLAGPRAFSDDPLRSLRLVRLAVELDFDVDPQTLEAAAQEAGRLDGVAAERIFSELRRTIVAPGALRGLELLHKTGATAAVLGELDALRGIEQTAYHHLDAHDHTVEVLERVIGLEADPAAVVGADLAARVDLLLAEPLSDELTRAGGLRLGAVFHDIAKPQTRAVAPDGRVGFPGHDREGAVMTRAILARLRTSERLRAHVAALTQHHLRLGFLVHAAPLDRRQIHRYLVACGPVAADVTLLSVCDRLATRGRKADLAIAAHLRVSAPVLSAALDHRDAGAAEPMIRGDALAAALGLRPGPQIGELLAAIAEAQYAGEVTDVEGALACARDTLAARD